MRTPGAADLTASEGFPVVLAGPSGGGKTTVARGLLARRSDLRFSVSATTREPRPDEADGRDYHFVGRERFEARIREGEFLEWAEVHGELYGTPRENLRRAREEGELLLLDIDVQGARQVRERAPRSVCIFLLPPDAKSLLRRLRERRSEDGAARRRRLRTALRELEEVDAFDYAVVNDELEHAVDTVDAILTAERVRVSGRGTAAGAQLARRLREDLERVLAGEDDPGTGSRTVKAGTETKTKTGTATRGGTKR